MARTKKNLIVFENSLTQEKMNYIASQHPGKTTQQLLDMAVDSLFKTEAENIQRNIVRLMGESPDNDDIKQ